ncbi:MAG: hypothetical protein II270_06410, partial [Peptococcaceae bacterium]|nr:hypothetical protein [Peptococcaceae bacterium]
MEEFMANVLSNKKPGPRTFLIGAAAFLLILGVVLFSMLTSTAPADKNNEEMMTITIEQGENANQIIGKLKENGI